MAGFREFMPGQVWFYYNMHASKELEKKKELGSCTNRPVVIVQSAFYPEWNDLVTVCPMTSSDRRSGVFIQSTILKDGSLVEGGTILPYLFFNVKTKFLYPLITATHKRKVLSLSPEDFAEVKKGILYHMGFSDEIPSYVENWKHLDDFDRRIVVRDVRLALNDYEEIAYDSTRSNVENVVKRSTPNPVLEQTAPDTDEIENHIISSLNHFDRAQKVVYEDSSNETDDSPFNTDTLNEAEDTPKVSKDVKVDHHINYTKMDINTFAQLLSQTIGGFYPSKQASQIYPQSTVLAEADLKSMTDILSAEDQMKILNMSAADIMDQTGIKSTSTAYRLKKDIREKDWGEFAHYDEEKKQMIFSQLDSPDIFKYDGSFVVSKVICKRHAKRRMVLFSYAQSDLLRFSALSDDELLKKLPGLGAKRSVCSAFKTDILQMYPSQFGTITMDVTPIEHPNAKSVASDIIAEPEALDPNKNEMKEPSYELWETLSPGEIRELKSCSKKNVGSIAKNFGISKDKARALRGQALNLVGRCPSRHQPYSVIDPRDACKKVMRDGGCTDEDFMIFCRTDTIDIADICASLSMDNTPSKAEIRRLKIALRKTITKDFA